MACDIISGFKETAEKSQKNSWYVYVHIFPNGKFYVGMTGRTPEERWQKGVGYKGQAHLYSAIKKYGWDNIYHSFVAVPSKKDAHIVEGLLIMLLNSVENGYNSRYEYDYYGESLTDDQHMDTLECLHDQVKWFRDQVKWWSDQVDVEQEHWRSLFDQYKRLQENRLELIEIIKVQEAHIRELKKRKMRFHLFARGG